MCGTNNICLDSFNKVKTFVRFKSLNKMMEKFNGSCIICTIIKITC